MNADAAKVVLESFVNGAFETLGQTLSLDVSCMFQAPETVAADRLGELLAAHPVAFSGRVQDAKGAVTLLLSTADAAHIASVLQEQETPAETLDEAGKSILMEIAPTMFESGLTRVVSPAEPEGKLLEDVQLETVGAEGAESLGELLGPDASMITFHYAAGDDFSGEAVALCGDRLQELLPGEGAAGDPTLSPGEMSDILSGFAGAEGGGALGVAAAGPENIDMVLDIQLVATARLGNIEMQIGDIVNLGPGSIIEMGRMVDQPVELLINNKLIAKGDVIVVDEKFGLRITEIISPKERIESLR